MVNLPAAGVDYHVPLGGRKGFQRRPPRTSPRAAKKLRVLIAEGGEAIEGPFDGEVAITLLADLDAGARVSMTSGMIVDQIKPVITDYHAGRIDAAVAGYARVLPAVNHENRQ